VRARHIFVIEKQKRFNEKLFDWKEIKITNNIFKKNCGTKVSNKNLKTETEKYSEFF
jgi:hypothetical protein